MIDIGNRSKAQTKDNNGLARTVSAFGLVGETPPWVTDTCDACIAFNLRQLSVLLVHQPLMKINSIMHEFVPWRVKNL